MRQVWVTCKFDPRLTTWLQVFDHDITDTILPQSLLNSGLLFWFWFCWEQTDWGTTWSPDSSEWFGMILNDSELWSDNLFVPNAFLFWPSLNHPRVLDSGSLFWTQWRSKLNRYNVAYIRPCTIVSKLPRSPPSWSELSQLLRNWKNVFKLLWGERQLMALNLQACTRQIRLVKGHYS